MVRKIEELDQQTDLDLLYFFKNIHEYADKDVKRWLAKLEFKDIVIAMLAMSYIEANIMEELGDLGENTEMVVLKKLCNTNEDNRNCDTNNAIASGRDPDKINEDCGGNADVSGFQNKNELHSGKDTSLLHSKNELHRDKWYLNRLDILVVPFIDTCNKHVVDLVFYVLKRSGLNYFGVLFDAFKTRNELLIELHLLVARAMKKDTFDFSEIKKTLENTEKPKGGLDFFEDSQDVASEEEAPSVVPHAFDGVIELGGFVRQEGLDVRPFQVNRAVGLADHLDKARELLLGHTVKSRVFFVENLSTYLSQHFDREICLLFMKQPRTYHFYKMLNKFEKPPFFLYKGVDLKKILLFEASRSFGIRKARAGEWHDFGEKIAQFMGLDIPAKPQKPDLYKHELVCNPYTLKYFVDYSEHVFNQKKADEQDLLFISSALPHFLRHFPHHALLGILYKLLYIVNATQVPNSVKGNLVFAAPVYLDFISQKADHSIRPDTLSPAPRLQSFAGDIATEWTYSTLPATNNHVVSAPSLEDSEEKIFAAFATPSIYDKLEHELATYFLDTYARATKSISYEKTRKELEKFMLACADYTPFKFMYIESLFLLHTLENYLEILAKLKDIKNTCWRYRALLIINHKKLVQLGVEPAWFKNTILSDKSFFLKKLVARIAAAE